MQHDPGMTQPDIPARKKAIETIGLAGVAALEQVGLVVVHLGAVSRAVAAIAELAELEDDKVIDSLNPLVGQLTMLLCKMPEPTAEAVREVIQGAGLMLEPVPSPLVHDFRAHAINGKVYAIGIIRARAASDRIVVPVWLANNARDGVSGIFALVLSYGAGDEITAPEEINGCPIVVINFPERS